MRYIGKALLGVVLLAASFGTTGCYLTLPGDCTSSGYTSSDGGGGGCIAMSPILIAPPPLDGFNVVTKVRYADVFPVKSVSIGDVTFAGALAQALPGAVGDIGYFVDTTEPIAINNGTVFEYDTIEPGEWSFDWISSNDVGGQLCGPLNSILNVPTFATAPPVLMVDSNSIAILTCTIFVSPGTGQVVFEGVNDTSSPLTVNEAAVFTPEFNPVDVSDNYWYWSSGDAEFFVNENQAADGSYPVDLTQYFSVHIDFYDYNGDYWETTYPYEVDPTDLSITQREMQILDPAYGPYTGFIQADYGDGSGDTVGAVNIQTYSY